MTFRNSNVPASLLRKATSVPWRALADRTRAAVTGGARKAATHSTRIAAQKPARVTAGVAAIATLGAIAAAAPWAGAATGPVAEARGGPAPTISAASHPATRDTSASAAPAPAATRAPAATPAPAATASQPQTIYDSVLPTAIPAGQHVATYSNGPYHATDASIAGRGTVLWIDTNGSDTKANALDVEPGDATPAEAASWVSQKLSDNPHADAIVYTFRAEWGEVQSNVSALPSWMQSHVKYWIADPTGTPHIVPGAAATQWYWGPSYDISMAQPGFFR